MSPTEQPSLASQDLEGDRHDDGVAEEGEGGVHRDRPAQAPRGHGDVRGGEGGPHGHGEVDVAGRRGVGGPRERDGRSVQASLALRIKKPLPIPK